MNPLLPELDLLQMFKTDSGYAYHFFTTSDDGSSFRGHSEKDLRDLFSDCCFKVSVGPKRTTFFFKPTTSIETMFYFRHKLNTL